MFAFWFGGCSGQQQEDEQLEVTQDSQQGQYAENQESGQQSEYAQNEQSDSQYAEQSGDNQYANQEESDSQLAEGTNETESDLQEIIQQMNGQEGEEMASDGMDAPLQQDLAETAPAMDAGMSGDMGMAPAGDMGGDMGAASTPLPFQPGGTPAGPALPEMGSKMPYVVQKGDTLAKISAKVYGDNSRWQEMASLSGLSNPSRIYPGDLVYYTLDDSSIAFSTAYESVTRNEEQVQPGDTLATIAQRVYGSSTAWRSIWRQNDQINNPDVVPPGTTVYYISQDALSAEVQKVRSQMSQLAAIKAKKFREVGIAMLDQHEDQSSFVNVSAINEVCMANSLNNNMMA
jgi:nucleoid-associated protein YgaU